jgi:hypothetical protein
MFLSSQISTKYTQLQNKSENSAQKPVLYLRVVIYLPLCCQVRQTTDSHSLHGLIYTSHLKIIFQSLDSPVLLPSVQHEKELRQGSQGFRSSLNNRKNGLLSNEKDDISFELLVPLRSKAYILLPPACGPLLATVTGAKCFIGQETHHSYIFGPNF